MSGWAELMMTSPDPTRDIGATRRSMKACSISALVAGRSCPCGAASGSGQGPRTTEVFGAVHSPADTPSTNRMLVRPSARPTMSDVLIATRRLQVCVDDNLRRQQLDGRNLAWLRFTLADIDAE